MIIRIHSEKGATLVEYMIGLAALLIIFLIGDQMLRESGERRIESSADTVSGMIPCRRGVDVNGNEVWTLDGDTSAGNSLECM